MSLERALPFAARAASAALCIAFAERFV